MTLPITILFLAHSPSQIYSSGNPLGIGLQSLCLHDYHVKINKKVGAKAYEMDFIKTPILRMQQLKRNKSKCLFKTMQPVKLVSSFEFRQWDSKVYAFNLVS